MLNQDAKDFEHYYFWATCCFFNVIPVFNHMTQLKLISEIFGVIVLAIKINYPFLYVWIMNYLIFGVIGGYVFGGNINSKTPEMMENMGQATKPEYIYQNWNDFLNSLVYLWGINLNNNMNMYISISVVNEGPTRNYKPIFFFVFYIMNNILLRSILIGQIIEISLAYFKVMNKELQRVEIMDEDAKAFHPGFKNIKDSDEKKIVRVKVS